MLKGASEILTMVHNSIDSSPSTLPLVNVLNALSITEDTYISALKLSHTGQSIVLQHDPAAVYTNGSNHNILHLWGANTDFKFFFDEYSTVMHICSYMIKSEKAMG